MRRTLVMSLTLCVASFAFAAADASAASAKVQPLVECVFHDTGTGQYIAVFGYNNPDAVTKTLAIGGSNNIAPNPADRGQGTTFDPGRHDNTFTVIWNGGGDIAWNLDTLNAHATTNSTACASNPVPAAGSQTIVWLLVVAGAVTLGGGIFEWRRRASVHSASSRAS
jgi:hypothetical protein